MTDQQDVTLTTRLKDILPEPPEKIISVCPKTTLDQLLKVCLHTPFSAFVALDATRS